MVLSWLPSVMPESHVVQQPAELLDFLLSCRPGVTRTKARQWLKYGSVQVNGQSVARPNHPLHPGDAVSIRGPREMPPRGFLPRGMKVLFEDRSLLVIEKPENLLSMASPTERQKTAYAYLTEYVRRGNRKSRERVWIVHRLDRETSGLMVFAKTEAAKHALQTHWDEVEKTYLAVIEGDLPDREGVFRSYLDESNPLKVYSTPPSERTRHAVTHYRVIKRVARRALVELKLQTGRRNQIRVHLAEAGCPVLGDHRYGSDVDPAGRLALHASSLRLKHPDSGELLVFESPLPKALARLL